MNRLCALFLISLCLSGCAETDNAAPAAISAAPTPGEDTVVFANATIWDGTGSPAQTNKILVVRDGRVVGVSDTMLAASGVEVVDLQGSWIVPGFINAHGHVSGRWADESVMNPVDRVRADLSLYARFGVTSLISLGGAGAEAFEARDDQADNALSHARVKLAGTVVRGETAADAAEMARQSIADGVDWIKLQIDDNLGTREKMPWVAVEAAIKVAREAGIPVATHIFYLQDAQRVLEMGTGLIAHSVRDQSVTDEFTQAMIAAGVCYVPTLTREISTFVYESRPDFFNDPFFLQSAKRSEIERVSQPEFMAEVRARPATEKYKMALQQAKENLKIVVDAGVPVAFGTDSGPAGRFPGYFEHMEFDLMADAGMSPEQILLSATSVAASCVHLDDVGTLEAGKWADFVVLAEDPLNDIRATRSITGVYIAGNAVKSVKRIQ